MTSPTWAIGDVQGCWRTLRNLLAQIGWKPGRGQLWLTGDLVNRGPRSLDVLRWAADQGDRLTTVLGNHDLHLLAIAAGVSTPRKGDTLEAVLRARDRDELIEWLRGRPLAVGREGRLLVHAGILSSWTAADTLRIARDVSKGLRGPDWVETLQAIAARGRDGAPARGALARRARHAGVLTRIRACSRRGVPLQGFNGPPEEAPSGSVPWFEVPGRRSIRTTIVFGHWAALGLLVRERLVALDTGCVWGNRLTAIRLGDRKIVDEPAAG